MRQFSHQNLPKMTRISNWLFAFLAIFSLSFFGCHLQLIDTSAKAGAMVYTHLSPVADGEVWPVYIDRSFTPLQQRQIDHALQHWNLAFNGHARLVVVDRAFDMQPDILQQTLDGKVYLVLPATPDNQFVESVSNHQYVIGITPYVGGHWIHLVTARLYITQVMGVTMHELGHAFGAEHTAGGLMNAIYNHDDQCVDYQAVIQVARFQGWDVHTMNYCYW